MDKIEAMGAAIHQENMAKRREEWAKEWETVMDDLVKRLQKVFDTLDAHLGDSDLADGEPYSDDDEFRESEPLVWLAKELVEIKAAIERLSAQKELQIKANQILVKKNSELRARIAELEKDAIEKKAVFDELFSANLKLIGDYNILHDRIAELESGQPVEVRGHVAKMQLVPVALHVDMIEAWSKLALERLKNPDANKGFEASMHETYRAILAASAAMLTASAQEAQEDKT